MSSFTKFSGLKSQCTCISTCVLKTIILALKLHLVSNAGRCRYLLKDYCYSKLQSQITENYSVDIPVKYYTVLKNVESYSNK